MFLKVEELKETVKEEFMPWVSQYLVMKRVSIEPNFHSLYSNFLDTLKNPEFVKMVLNETYRNIKVIFLKYNMIKTKVCLRYDDLMLSHFVFQVLLTSDKAAANFSDRSLLKNLGHWLGIITLSKNKPILYTVSSFLLSITWAWDIYRKNQFFIIPVVWLR